MISIEAGAGLGEPVTGLAVLDVETSTGTAIFPMADSPITGSVHPAIPAAMAPVKTNRETHPSRVRIPFVGSEMIRVQTFVSA